MSIQLAPRAGTSDAVVSITAHVPDDAMSAGLLGTERVGHGVRIRADGLIATIGYVVHEAENLWIGTRDTVVPGFVIGYDFDSGLALVKPSLPLHGPSMELGRADALSIGDAVTVMSSGGKEQSIEARVVAKQEFAGRWEYVLDQAVFTTPPHESWSGAALVDSDGRLCGLGSLVIQGFEARSGTSTVNMFVPIELLAPIIDEICEHGRRLTPPRPWLGMLVHDDQHDLTVVGVYRNCPADKAGLRPGDVIVGIDDEPVVGLANMFRRVWSLGAQASTCRSTCCATPRRWSSGSARATAPGFSARARCSNPAPRNANGGRSRRSRERFCEPLLFLRGGDTGDGNRRTIGRRPAPCPSRPRSPATTPQSRAPARRSANRRPSPGSRTCWSRSRAAPRCLRRRCSE